MVHTPHPNGLGAGESAGPLGTGIEISSRKISELLGGIMQSPTSKTFLLEADMSEDIVTDIIISISIYIFIPPIDSTPINELPWRRRA